MSESKTTLRKRIIGLSNNYDSFKSESQSNGNYHFNITGKNGNDYYRLKDLKFSRFNSTSPLPNRNDFENLLEQLKNGSIDVEGFITNLSTTNKTLFLEFQHHIFHDLFLEPIITKHKERAIQIGKEEARREYERIIEGMQKPSPIDKYKILKEHIFKLPKNHRLDRKEAREIKRRINKTLRSLPTTLQDSINPNIGDVNSDDNNILHKRDNRIDDLVDIIQQSFTIEDTPTRQSWRTYEPELRRFEKELKLLVIDVDIPSTNQSK